MRGQDFIPTVPIDASSFTLWIQQSIPIFCSDVDQASVAGDEICQSDIMKTDDDVVSLSSPSGQELANIRKWQSSPQAIAYALHVAVRGVLMALPSPVPRYVSCQLWRIDIRKLWNNKKLTGRRNQQKILKPQFFERYRLERENLALLDTAAAHIAKKAIAASLALSELQLSTASEEAPWGGLSSKSTLASELVPMMIKIQSLGHSTSHSLKTARYADKLSRTSFAIIGQAADALAVDELATASRHCARIDSQRLRNGDGGIRAGSCRGRWLRLRGSR